MEYDRREDGRDETPNVRADRNWSELLQELRAVQMGSQIFGGFLLTLPFQERFSALDDTQVAVYLTLVALAAIVTILGLAPVVLHRMLFRRGAKARLVRFGNVLVKCMLALVALLTIGIAVLLFDVVAGHSIGIIAGCIATLVVAALAVVAYAQRRSIDRDGEGSS
ncbi:sodium:proton antiporter [Salinibacterium hongtaonis]|uniref:Sodium:proton antiporter n=1 Tax=Homoserinimonas hongtaonis TaxID=2079791 RepID=A0A2U1T389_9MICO|nr:sodium:proton antiporter [Salinibacterium hongtaonis]